MCMSDKPSGMAYHAAGLPVYIHPHTEHCIMYHAATMDQHAATGYL